MSFKDLTGMRFGRLKVIERKPNNSWRQAMWLCQCDCGETKIVVGRNLTSGGTRSCGCLQRESVPYDDLTGKRYCRLTVVRETDRPNGKKNRHYWLCRCDCGNEIVLSSSAFNSGLTKSCGCYHREEVSERMRKTKTTHGKTNTRLYGIWGSMKGRCYLQSSTDYPWYGGRGIKVCDEWKDSFEAFEKWAIENGYDPTAPRGKCTIDRIDPNGNYSPDNCRFITQKEQGNNRCNTLKIECGGEKHTVSEWSEITGIPAKTIYDRLRYPKRSIEDVLFKPRRIWG